MKHVKILKLLFFIICSWHWCTDASIISGTVVKTPDGNVPIEQLNVGDYLVTFSLQQAQVLSVKQTKCNKVIAIELEICTVHATPEQLFYDPLQQSWVRAYALTSASVLVDSNGEYQQCLSVCCIDEFATAYDITVESPHVLYVSPAKILTHNFLPIPIGIGVSFVLGGGEVVFTGISILGGAAAALSFLKHLFCAEKIYSREQEIKPATLQEPQIHHANNNQNQQQSNNAPQLPTDSSKDPEKDNNRKKNTVTKTEFFYAIKKAYEYIRNGYYHLRKGQQAIEGAEYLKWDYTHNDVEAFKGKMHIGSIDPQTMKLYKPPIVGRIAPRL